MSNNLQAQRQAEFALASGKSVNVRLNHSNIGRVVHGSKVHSAQQVANECKWVCGVCVCVCLCVCLCVCVCLFVCNLNVNFNCFCNIYLVQMFFCVLFKDLNRELLRK